MDCTYLDNASTTRLDERVLEAMLPYLKEDFGNPSSAHRMGEKAADAIETAREIIAASVNASPEQVVFTSGGTESCNLGIMLARYMGDSSRASKNVVISCIEHPAVRESALSLKDHGFCINEVPVSKEGLVEPEGFADRLRDGCSLSSLMHVNNEIGTIQPISDVSRVCSDAGVPFFVDCVQSYLKLPIDFNALFPSAIAVSAHKVHGPKGVGAVIFAEDARPGKILFGGGQKSGIRPGTPSVAGIVGFGEAVRLGHPIDEDSIRSIAVLRDRLIDGLLNSIPLSSLNGSREFRVCNNVNVAFDRVEARALLEWLDDRGVFASTGSACSSSHLEPSRVLASIGLPAQKALGSIRFSLSRYTSRDEIDETVDLVREGVAFLRNRT